MQLSERNKKVVERLIQTVFINHDLSELDEIMQKAMAVDLNQRYSSCAAFADALDGLIGHHLGQQKQDAPAVATLPAELMNIAF